VLRRRRGCPLARQYAALPCLQPPHRVETARRSEIALWMRCRRYCAHRSRRPLGSGSAECIQLDPVAPGRISIAPIHLISHHSRSTSSIDGCRQPHSAMCRRSIPRFSTPRPASRVSHFSIRVRIESGLPASDSEPAIFPVHDKIAEDGEIAGGCVPAMHQAELLIGAEAA
jgi:hypothetical protein